MKPFKQLFSWLAGKTANQNTVVDDSSYCYSSSIWNGEKYFVILISYSEDYLADAVEILDAIGKSYLESQVVTSSYNENVETSEEENDKTVRHNKYYLLIGGFESNWHSLYDNINDISNRILSKITDEINNNRNVCSCCLHILVMDHILTDKHITPKYDKTITIDDKCDAVDIAVVRSRLPKSFTIRNIIPFIMIYSTVDTCSIKTAIDKGSKYYCERASIILSKVMNHKPSKEELNIFSLPLYQQPDLDDDYLPGDMSDEALDDIFKEKYEKFSAVYDESSEYEDIDEIIGDDEET